MKLKGIEVMGTYKVEYNTTNFGIYNEKGNMIYFENSNDYWSKWEYDEKGKEIYYEDSKSIVFDYRVKELTIEEIEKLLGYKIKIKGE